MKHTKDTALLSAKDVMKTEVLTLRSDATLKEAWELLDSHKISGAPVVNMKGELVGVLSQHDLARRALNQSDLEAERPSLYYLVPTMLESLAPAEESRSEMLNARVDKVMNPYVVTVGPDDSVAEVVSTMRSHHVHRVIVTRERKILGLISTFDLLELI